MSEDYAFAAEALKHFAFAYLLKRSSGLELVKAIRKVLKAGTHVTPKLVRGLLEELIRDPTRSRIKILTTRQRTMLQLHADGQTTKEIAAILHIKSRAVVFHKYPIMEVLGRQTNAELVRLAISEHLVPQP